MRYRLTCLTPLLVGDGHRLSPIDYMVWKDQVNVLDQRRIFRLLAKGPRLDGYLQQLKKAEKLDFASWGGFAQNFADRRVPFEHPSATAFWERAQGDTLHIPTFASGLNGPYLPGSAIKGALRTGLLFQRWKDAPPRELERFQGDRLPRRAGEAAEEQAIGGPATSFMRAVSLGDSGPVSTGALRVYLLRVSTLQARGGGRFEVGWKQAPRATVSRAEDSTPAFAEMAMPGTVFEGELRENQYVSQPEVRRALRWRDAVTAGRVLEQANQHACRVLEIQKRYASCAGLQALERGIEALEAEVGRSRESGNACLLTMGWGGGILSKSGWLDTDSDVYRQTLKAVPLYTRALESGLPFPKTRKIVFMGNQPAALPGWAKFEALD